MSVVAKLISISFVLAASLAVWSHASAQDQPAPVAESQARCKCWVDVKTGKKVPTVPLTGINISGTIGAEGTPQDPGVAIISADRKTAVNTRTKQNYAREADGCWVDVKTGKVVPTVPLTGVNISGAIGAEGTPQDPGVAIISADRKTAVNTRTKQNYALEDCTLPTEKPVTPPPAEECDPVLTKISDLVDQLATTSETVGRVKQRIADSEIAKDTPPEEKKAALEADSLILRDKEHLALKLKLEVLDLWDNFTKNLPCNKSRPRLRHLLDDLDDKSQRIGRFQELLDRHRGYVDPKGLDAERNEAKSIINEIKDLFASCCAKKQVSQNPQETFKRTEVFVGYQFERAPDEQAKNLNGINGQVFYDFKKHIGIGADFAWTTGSDRIGTTTDVTLHRFTGLFGPRFNFTHSAHNESDYQMLNSLVFHFPILIGVAHDSTSIKFPSSFSTSSASTAFMMSFGANMDVMLKKNFGVRPFDFAYQPTHLGGNWQSNWKLGAGIVFRFGEKK